jgi:hypothetical protein
VRRGAAGARGIPRGGAPHAPRVAMLPAKGVCERVQRRGKSDPFRGHPLLVNQKQSVTDVEADELRPIIHTCVTSLYCPQYILYLYLYLYFKPRAYEKK